MATHSSIPPWRIPWTEEPGGVQSRGRTQLSDRHFHQVWVTLKGERSVGHKPQDAGRLGTVQSLPAAEQIFRAHSQKRTASSECVCVCACVLAGGSHRFASPPVTCKSVFAHSLDSWVYHQTFLFLPIWQVKK